MPNSSIGQPAGSPKKGSSSNPHRARHGVPIIIGEVLWDCFESHRSLGGAPLNVAWNLAGLGLDPLFISAVGDDELGREILQRMSDFGMTTDGVAVLSGVATGTVQVTMNDGEPQYDIVRDVAWDQIPAPARIRVHEQTLQDVINDRVATAQAGGEPVMVYHGSLACRDQRSRSTIEALRDCVDGWVFFDVNLRAPHFEHDVLEALRRRASIIKLNLDELGELTRGIENGSSHPEATTQMAGDAFARSAATPLEMLLVTLGADGAIAYQPADNFQSMPTMQRVHSPEPQTMTDPVGAGDAFASVVIHGLLTGREMKDVLPDAAAFASRVCGLAGATCADRDFYSI